jgi:glycosyltransferase involved in cell wall biosynthesis
MPKVSVIVPNYNHAPYLKERMDSIFQQSMADFEVLFLDDRSQDGSIEIAQQYQKDPRFVALLENDVNSGSTFIQWEKGLRLAKGEYIWLAESDDVAHPDFLKVLCEALDQHPDLSVAYTSSVWIDAEGVEMHRPPHEKGDEVFPGKLLVQKEFLQGPLVYNASSALFRKPQNVDFTLLRTFRYAGDWLFWVMLAGNSGVLRLDLRYNFFRRHENNVSFRSEREGLLFTEGFRIIAYIYQHYPVSWISKRRAALKWSRRIGHFREGIPQEVQFYHRLFSIFK